MSWGTVKGCVANWAVPSGRLRPRSLRMECVNTGQQTLGITSRSRGVIKARKTGSALSGCFWLFQFGGLMSNPQPNPKGLSTPTQSAIHSSTHPFSNSYSPFNLSIHPSIHPSIYPLTLLLIHPSTHSSIHSSIHPSIHFTHPPIHPSIHSLLPTLPLCGGGLLDQVLATWVGWYEQLYSKSQRKKFKT